MRDTPAWPCLPLPPSIPAEDAASYAKSDHGEFPLGPDSRPQDGVAQGALACGRMEDCRSYPGAAHRYGLYSPPGAPPERLMVFLDGRMFLDPRVRATTVLDNLIHAGRIPPMAALFVDAGDKGPGLPLYGGDDNRSVEYDAITPTFCGFLLDELLPQLRRDHGLTVKPEAMGLAGISSGGAAAFTAAWHRPDAFDKVLSLVGSFVNIRGAHTLASMIRREPAKTIRVFLQSGAHDLDTLFGDWALANQDVASALRYRGYDHRFEFGEGGHSPKHGAALLPDALTWLWAPGRVADPRSD